MSTKTYQLIIGSLIGVCVGAIIIIFIIIFMAVKADAHEDAVMKHMQGSSGPLIGMRECGAGAQAWCHDDNEDGVVDRCSIVLFLHDQVHRAPGRMQLERGIDGEMNRIGCSCEVIVNGY